MNSENESSTENKVSLHYALL